MVRRGTKCSPAARKSTTRTRDGRLAVPRLPWAIRPRVRPACAKVGARKKIHAKQTKWNVARTARHAADEGPVPVLSEAAPRCHRRVDGERAAVERAPDDEVPRRAVPEAAEDHREHQVAVRLPRAGRGCRRAGCRGSRAATSTARCASAARTPGGSRDDVRRVEVLRELEAEELRAADRDVGVAGEVA